MEVSVKNSENRFLQTSPEFAMKKLLAGGMKKIYQSAKVFRDEPLSETHLPEFTMLEWYRAEANLEEIMNDVEELFGEFDRSIPLPFKLPEKWPRFTTAALFKQYVEVDLNKATKKGNLSEECERLGVETSSDDDFDDQYFRIWLNCIEPKLPKDSAFFVTHYPPSQAALAELTQHEGQSWANRFEAYVGGYELANAFQELTDAAEQLRRFEADMDLREKKYGASFPRSPIDEEFIQALKEGYPRSAGIALGIDRMIMLFTDETDIRYTIY